MPTFAVTCKVYIFRLKVIIFVSIKYRDLSRFLKKAMNLFVIIS